MEELKTLIRKRASLKTRMTLFKKYFDDLHSKCDLDSNLSDVMSIELESRIIKVEPILDEFDEVQSLIEGIAEDDAQDDHLIEREAFEKQYFENIANAKALFNKTQTVDSDSSSVQSAVSVSNITQQLNNVKLPTIQLPTFSGAYDGWLEFRDTFESLIHLNSCISDIQKFHYLRAALVGDAAQVIKSIEFSASNYNDAWEILGERYNNSRLLIHNHVKALFELESMNKESAPKIRKLIDNVAKHLRTLKTLGEKTSDWDTLLVYIITEKIDSSTAREWEEQKFDSAVLLCDLIKFLRSKANLLETLEHTQTSHSKSAVKTTKSFVNTNASCFYCNQDHAIYNCSNFNNLSIKERIEFAKSKSLCLNCLKKGHVATTCYHGSCKKCKLKHNTLLHCESSTVALSSNVNTNHQNILLSTACIQIIDKHGSIHNARALLDSGSQSSFMTTNLCNRLKLNKTKIDLSVIGINQASSKINNKCVGTIQAPHNNFKLDVSFLVIDDITGSVPNNKININGLEIPSNIKLADPAFEQPGQIDILLGADCFWNLTCVGNIKLGANKPILQKTRFGWVVSGPINTELHNKVHCNLSKTISDQIEQFWKIEECFEEAPHSIEQKECESHFANNYKRDDLGRFIVSIPWKRSIDSLGDSSDRAKRRFWALERKLAANVELRNEYTKFMREYEALGHMSRVINADQGVRYYLPHHAVLKQSSSTTKLRVVFDGSAKTTSGISTNDIQMTGPTIQDSLIAILMRFRKHKFVLSADVAKMYRQVLVNSQDRALQSIFWRESPSDSLCTFELNTVTYGTAAASFLAIRCLHELASVYSVRHPISAAIIRRDFYVDDLLTGSDSIDDLITLKSEIADILCSAHFELRKWSSNDPRLLDSNINSVEIASDANKTLGIAWSPITDSLSYSIALYIPSEKTSKRSILSSIAQIFDPLGLLAPTIVIPKIIMQELWKFKLTWDESIPMDLHTKWSNFRKDLYNLNNLCIKRKILIDAPIRVELHGFADASTDAYGACVYLRSIGSTNDVVTNLLIAKSKVAPLKTQTIPKLELCAAVLLARLTNKVILALDIKFDKCYLWSDSTIVLCWIRTSPNLLKVFVNNRIAEIQETTKTCEWRHVPTKDNPADYLSRGISPNDIKELQLWWHGPSWLNENCSKWPNSILPVIESLPEVRQELNSLLVKNERIAFPFEKYSNVQRLERIIAYCLRFKTLCSNPQIKRVKGSLTCSELHAASKALIRIAQRDDFLDDIQSLEKGGGITSSSKIYNLNPFLDEEGILRVGGRIENSEFEYSKKHPMIISHKHHLAKLIVAREHIRLFHAAPQLLLASIRESLWVISGRNLAKRTVRECVKCHRFNPISVTPKMGNLPAHRVQPAPPFYITGVDYAGPFLLKDKKGRGNKRIKCYISLFVCFATKAIHLELVSDLTKDAFIAAFRRFVSRRGKPNKMFSDNGTCFVGANNELKNLGDFLIKGHDNIVESIAMEGVEWKFIPAYSPHFGGLWEAGVKSVKSHLKRVIGNASLIFEEFYTILVQIESILNSRPITPMSDHPNDLNPLTPAHFLIGRPITSLPDDNLNALPEGRLSNYQRLQQLSQHFWSRWSVEYISELQQRAKWNKEKSNVQTGAMVLIKEDNQPPMRWQLGRVLELHPGTDGVVRVVTIRTQRGNIRRAVAKICPLPIESV